MSYNARLGEVRLKRVLRLANVINKYNYENNIIHLKKTPMKKEQIILTKMLWFSIGFTLAIVLMYSIVADGKL